MRNGKESISDRNTNRINTIVSDNILGDTYMMSEATLRHKYFLFTSILHDIECFVDNIQEDPTHLGNVMEETNQIRGALRKSGITTK